MSFWLIAGIVVLFAILGAAAWAAASRPGFWLGMGGAIIKAVLPHLKGSGGPNSAIAKSRKRVKRENGK